jgi:hypothetical protein
MACTMNSLNTKTGNLFNQTGKANASSRVFDRQETKMAFSPQQAATDPIGGAEPLRSMIRI